MDSIASMRLCTETLVLSYPRLSGSEETSMNPTNAAGHRYMKPVFSDVLRAPRNLLRCGASINAVVSTEISELNPLSICVWASQLEMLEFLLSQDADPWILDNSQYRDTLRILLRNFPLKLFVSCLTRIVGLRSPAIHGCTLPCIAPLLPEFRMLSAF